MKIFILFFTLLISFNLSFSDNNDDSCKWHYRCCKREHGICVKLCDADIRCDPPETTTEVPENLESSTFEGTVETRVITAQCRKGFKHDTQGRCRRVLK